MKTIAQLMILAVLGASLTIARAQEEPAPAQLQEVQAVLRKVEEKIRPVFAPLSPAPTIEYPDHTQSIVISYRTRKFLVHGHTKTAEWSTDTHEETGPSGTGFLLQIHLQKHGEANQADTPLTHQEPYWRTFLEVTPIDGTKHQIFWAFSSAGRTHEKLLASLREVLGSLAGNETKAGSEKLDGAARVFETNLTAPMTVLSGRNASKELGVFMSERWNRQVWQIECRTAMGYTNPSPTWHVKGTMDWVRFVGPEYLKEHLDINKLDPASTYEVTGVPVDFNYGCYSLYILSLPKKVDVSKPAVNMKEQVPSTGGIVGRVLDVPIPHHRQRILHKDAEFEITANDYGAPDAKEIALMVHDVRSDRWAILDSVSTIGATFGYVPMDKIKSCPAPWDFIIHASHEAVPLPLGKGGPLHFPDLIEDKGSFYAVSHDTSWKDDRMATVLRFDKEALRKIFR